jgi:hypothetical protein
MRPSTSALEAVGQILTSGRDQIHAEWAEWVVKRLNSRQPPRRKALERQLGLLLDILNEVAGPLRRESTELWLNASEWYGRTAAQRGLAAGEIVEEFQHLRELLIRHLSEAVFSLPARKSLASVLRLNRVLDSGIAHAVVGYTDVLVESILERQGIPVGALETAESEIETRLDQFERDLAELKELAV